MAIFGWLQKWFKYLLSWIGIIDTDDSGWGDLSTQLNLLNDQMTQSSYFTNTDMEIKAIPIDSYIDFPRKLWMVSHTRKYTVIDDVFYMHQELVPSGDYDANSERARNVYKSANLSTFSKIEYVFYSGNFLSGGFTIKISYGLDNLVRIVKTGDYYYNQIGRYWIEDNGDRSSQDYNTLYFNDNSSPLCVCQTVFGSDLIQLIKRYSNNIDSRLYNYGTLYVNGASSDLPIPKVSSTQFTQDGEIVSYYNSLPHHGIASAANATLPYTKYDMASGANLYVMYNDLLYQYDSTFAMQNIYHIPFANFGLFYMSGSLYFKTRRGAVKCNLN